MKLNILSIALVAAEAETRVGDPDQIITDELYWCCRDNKSLGSCVQSVKNKLNLYTIGNFGCSITNTIPAYAWKTYEGYNDECKLYCNCGTDAGRGPDWRTLDNACMAAAYACNGDLECARDHIVRSHNMGTHKWCANRFNLLVNRNPGSSASNVPSGSSQTTAGSISCLGFCVTN